jgi:hypothetical protein
MEEIPIVSPPREKNTHFEMVYRMFLNRFMTASSRGCYRREFRQEGFFYSVIKALLISADKRRKMEIIKAIKQAPEVTENIKITFYFYLSYLF